MSMPPKSRPETRIWVHRLYVGGSPRKQRKESEAGDERRKGQRGTYKVMVIMPFGLTKGFRGVFYFQTVIVGYTCIVRWQGY